MTCSILHNIYKTRKNKLFEITIQYEHYRIRNNIVFRIIQIRREIVELFIFFQIYTVEKINNVVFTLYAILR